MSARAAPLRAVALVLGAWTVARLVIVASGSAGAPHARGPMPSRRPAANAAPAAFAMAPMTPAPFLRIAAMSVTPVPTHGRLDPRSADGSVRLSHAMDPSALLLLAAYSSAPRGIGGGATAADAFASAPVGAAGEGDAPGTAPLLSLAPHSLDGGGPRWSGSAWLYARGGTGPLALGQSQIGGAQAGARIAYRLDDAGRFAAAARSYAPLHERGAEIAAGIEWHPAPRLPLRLAIERRQALERGGRSAWQASAAGGYDGEPIAGALRLDAYAQAGVVGARAHDLFADGSLRAGYPVRLGERTSLTAGAGLWGAAQPRAARLDLGPQAALRLPAGDAGLVLAIDWRLRAAGRSRPGSGPALTLAADF